MAVSSPPPVVKFCSGCGTGLVATAVTCPSCGTKASGTGAGTPKSKTTAVVLAVFLSFWSWLYTYKKSTWKFWVGLAVAFLGSPLYLIPTLGVWIWAIVDNSIKPKEFYEDYWT